jgi:arabinogalactan endo-1,4-beta-galactosidase
MMKRRTFLGGHLGLIGVLTLSATAQAAAVDLQNASFDADGGVASPSGWTSEGSEGADYTEWGGYTGDYRLSHYSGEDYFVDTKQTVTGLERGWYTLRGFARRSSGENGAYLELDCGSGPQQVAIPVAWPNQWLELAVSAYTRKGDCTITLHTDGAAGEWSNFDAISLVPGRVGVPIRGADVSSLPKSEDLGGLYYSDLGRRQSRADSALEILEEHGTTHLRVRVWVDSADGYHGVEEIARLARRAKHEELKMLVDLHYSDFWADPGQQAKPAAWEGFSVEELEAAVYNHTYEVCTKVKRAGGRAPDMIQIGNELNSGMLWPDGHTWGPPNWENLGRFLSAGAQAVRNCSSTTKVVLHLAEGGNNGAFRWWFDNITAQGVDFDIIAASYYGYWHGSLGDLQYNLKDMASRYDKDVLVAETAYPFTLDWADDQSNIIGAPGQLVAGYEASPYGQAENLRDVLSVVRGIPDGRGLGVFYWDATWTVVPGNGWDPTDQSSGNTWENQALFDFSGRALPAMSEFLVDDAGRGRSHRRGGYCR